MTRLRTSPRKRPARSLPGPPPGASLRYAVAVVLLICGSGVGPAIAQGDPFSAPGTLQALKLRGLTARPAALMLSGQVGGPIPLALLAVPFPSTTEVATVALMVEIGTAVIPRADPASSTGTAERRVEIYAYAIDDAGKPRANLSQVFQIPPPSGTEEAATKGAKFLAHLEVPPGTYDLRVLVIATPSGSFGLQRVSLTVPPAASALPAPPLIAEPSSAAWTLVREAPHGSTGLDPYPFRAAGQAFLPSARPVLADGDDPAVYVLASAGAQGGLEVSGRLEADDAPLGELTGGSFQTTGSASVPWQWSYGSLTVDSPARGLAALTLRVGEEETPPLEVLLVAASASNSRSPWPAFVASPESPAGAADADGTTPVAATEAAEEDKEKLSRRELIRIGRQYQEVLLDLAEGKGAAARTSLTLLEGEIIDGRSLGAVAALRDAELSVLRAAAQGRPGILLPPARLHFQLLESYTRDRRLLLSVHARQMFRALVGDFVSAAKAPQERSMAANLYARFGVYLQDVSLRNESEETFRTALALDPANELALRALAASYERSGQLRPAAELLRQLRRLRPEDAEACVRLGRALKESGRQAQGEKEWRSCLELQRPAWAVELVYQELARAQIGDERWAEAEKLLRAAIERFPRQERLALLLAYVLDRQQKPADGRTILGRHAAFSGTDASARYRYGRWPRAAFAAVLRQTDAAIDEQLPALAEAIADPKKRRSTR